MKFREVTKLKLFVNNSPFTEEQVTLLNELLPQLTEQQSLWLTGYLSAASTKLSATDIATSTTLLEGANALQVEEVAKVETKTATILYGSQTGNSQGLAEKLAQELAGNNVEVTVSSLSNFKLNSLKKLTTLFLVVSTYGEGDPPDNAIQFHDFIHSKRAPKLDHLQYSVLALGDSSYELFCKTGIDFDEQFEKLGAKRIVPRVDCDLDFDGPAAEWIKSVKEALQTTTSSSASVEKDEQKVVQETTYSKNNPYYAEVLEKINLNGRGSNKETYHLELSLEESNLTYEPGDSIGIIPENDERIVDLLIQKIGFDENEQVTIKEGTFTLKEALQKKLEITSLSKPLLKKVAEFTENSSLIKLLEDEVALKEYIYGRDLIDVVEDYGPFTWTAQQFAEQLRKIPVRLYSIASSLQANEEEVHLTIGKVSYETNNRKRFGVASGQVANRIGIGDKIPVYVHKAPNFKLPQDEKTPIIMIGAGTGIAPYRSFLEERAELGIEGKSWLFFGDQHFVTDFLYQTELQRWLKDGDLTKLDVAFSRDTDKKVYVQHRMQENAQELYEWIEQGAVIYVCGDKDRMAKDVEETLLQIISVQGGKSLEEATELLKEFRRQKRYQRDVY